MYFIQGSYRVLKVQKTLYFFTSVLEYEYSQPSHHKKCWYFPFCNPCICKNLQISHQEAGNEGVSMLNTP